MIARASGLNWNDRIGRRLKLHDLHIFLTVAEAGSMGKAAERLSISQPSISKAIADVEHTVGVRLLDRSATGVELTDYGRALVGRGIAAFDELRQGIKDIEFLADPTAGEVRVGCPEPIASGLLLAVLIRFTRLYPRVIVSVFSTNNLAHELGLLRERKVDLLIGGISSPLAQEDLHSDVLYEDQPFIVVGVKNRWAGLRKVELAELIKEPWLLPRDSIFSTFMSDIFRSHGLPFPKIGVRTYSVHQRLDLLTTDRFVGAESGSVLRFNADRYPLKVLPVDFAAAHRFTVAIVTLKNRPISPLGMAFVECVHNDARPMVRSYAAQHSRAEAEEK